MVDALQFTTNTGATSPKMGGNGGSRQTLDVNGRISNVEVYMGNGVDAIKFYMWQD